MTSCYLLPYTCTRCNSLRRTWFEVIDDHDREIIKQYYESTNAMVVLNDLVEMELLCAKCMKNEDILQWA